MQFWQIKNFVWYYVTIGMFLKYFFAFGHAFMFLFTGRLH